MHGMEIELVSKLGARLPHGGGLLSFGTTELEARRRLGGLLAEPERTSFGRGAAWGWRVAVGDRWIEASAGSDGLLGEIRVARAIEAARNGPAGMPVVYRGIDLFKLAIAEIEFLLGAVEDGIGGDLRLTGLSGYAECATLVDLSRS
jgi:hypothetical protein